MTTSTARIEEIGGIGVIHDYGDVSGEYTAAMSGAALYNSQLRGLIQVTRKDRATWLHNLVTNAVKTLQPGQGNYAFALNVKGRILFDLNILVLPDALWLDLDRRLLAKAMTHLNKYIISEDVEIVDRTADYVRFALLGPLAAQVADAVGAIQVQSQAALSSVSATLVQKSRLLVRHDFAGVFGAELHVETADADACWKRLLEIGEPLGLRPVGHAAVETLRIEAGIPVSVQDIDEEVLPAETQQLTRGINFNKGCYLGQEVVERMRSHNVLARKLVGLRLSGSPPIPGVLRSGDTDAGRITSACVSPALGGWIGLGYAKAAQAAAGTMLAIADSSITATLTPLPFRPTPSES